MVRISFAALNFLESVIDLAGAHDDLPDHPQAPSTGRYGVMACEHAEVPFSAEAERPD
jgi:hypothetical protein